MRSGQLKERYPLTHEEAAEWIDALRVVYDEGYLSAQKFQDLRRSILARVPRQHDRAA